MNYWIFQGKPERYDVAEKIKPGATETWVATRYRDEMKIDDIVLFWRSGEPFKRGLYGWGLVASEPKFIDKFGWGITVIYKKKFEHPLNFSEIGALPTFSSHVLFKMPIGTNFKLSEKEFKELNNLIVQLNGQESSPLNLEP
jgi:hypothetical protein